MDDEVANNIVKISNVKMEIRENRCESETSENETTDNEAIVNEKSSTCNNTSNDSEEVTPSEEFDPVENLWIKEKCIFCEKVLINLEGVKLLQCLHSSCTPCITNRSTGEGTVTCPLCKVESINYIDNYFVLEQSNPSDDNSQSGNDCSREVKCTSCSESPIATSWCVECCEFICDGCVQAHQRLKITKDHTIKSKDDADADKIFNEMVDGVISKFMCEVHCQEKLTLFCETCSVVTCRDCQLTDHREHKYKFVDEMASITKKAITTLLSEVNYKRVLLKSAMNVIDDRQLMIANKKKDLCNEITQAVYKLTSSVANRGKQLVAKLNEVCETKQKTLNDKKNALQHLAFLTDHCIQSINSAVSHGSDMSILRSKVFIMNYLRNVKSKRADIPNPDIPVRIQVNLDRVSEIANVVSTLGSIMVDGRVYPSPSSSPSLSPSSSCSLQGQQLTTQTPQPTPPQQQQLTPVSVQEIQFRGQPSTTYQQQQQQQQPNHSVHREYQTSPHLVTNNVFQPPPPYSNSRSPVYFQNQTPKSNNNLQTIAGHVINNNAVAAASATRNIYNYQQQVTSSTHPQNMLPHHQQFVQDQNLRSLLMNSEKVQHFPPNVSVVSNVTMRSNSVHPNQCANIAVRHPVSVSGQIANNRPPSYSQNHRYYQQNPQKPITTTGTILKVEYKPPPPTTTLILDNGQFAHQNKMKLNTARNRITTMPSDGLSHSISPQPPHVQWHTPQISTSNTTNKQLPSLPTMLSTNNANDASYKITLKPLRTQSASTPPGVSVSSSVSKTPSPQNHVKSPGETEKNIDKLERDSVKDLMATIAKLDSKAVVVMPVGGSGGGADGSDRKRKPSRSPLVDSSTGPQVDQMLNNQMNGTDGNHNNLECAGDNQNMADHYDLLDEDLDDIEPFDIQRSTKGTKIRNKSSLSSDAGNAIPAESQRTNDDPNEDWCAVCMDGGKLICCDNCPKVFHSTCHIPVLPDDDDLTGAWQCMLCTNISDCVSIVNNGTDEKRPGEGLTVREQTIMEKILLELYCQYEQSLPFRELINPDVTDYYEKIKKPMCLDMVRERLIKQVPARYENIGEMVKDVRLIFKNAYMFNEDNSRVYMDAKSLEEFFDQMLEKWLPVYYVFDDSSRLSTINGVVDYDDTTAACPSPPKRVKRTANDE